MPQQKVTERKYGPGATAVGGSGAKNQPFMRRNILNQTMGHQRDFLNQSIDNNRNRSSNRSSINREERRSIASRERMSSLKQLERDGSDTRKWRDNSQGQQ